MSERITIVVPDGTRKKLKDKADRQGHTPSALGRKYLLDGLKDTEVENVFIQANGNLKATVSGKDLTFILDRSKGGTAV